MVKLEKNNPIVISLVTDIQERQRVIAFINKVAFKWHQCFPPPPPPILFVAKQESEIVGTIAFNFGDKNRPLPLERIYGFDYSKTPWPFVREKITQYGRLTAIIPDVAMVISYVTTVYALARGKLYGLAELKDRVAEHQRKIGVKLYLVPGAKLNIDEISEGEKNYYLTSPVPKLYMFSLEQVERDYRKKVTSLIRERKFIIDSCIKVSNFVEKTKKRR